MVGWGPKNKCEKIEQNVNEKVSFYIKRPVEL